MKREAAFFEDREPVLVYIAKRLSDALKLETILDTSGVDYGVEADEYRGGTIFSRIRVGAFFYVLPEAETGVREIMVRNGYKPYDEPRPPSEQSAKE